ncbi:esterase [Nocardia sp. NPDC051832]|uniref:LGFP repeat-containing protein n=1 Tax=Nocardia sp. NPDC051832 TaxID=3155673 RepID=UPI003438650D
MTHFARRTATFTAALGVAALLLSAGCSEDEAKENVDKAKGAVTSVLATPSPTASGSATGSETAGGSATSTTEAAEETKIATQGGQEVTISGDIYEKYLAAGGATGALGLPLEAQENGPAGGKYQDFAGGTIYEAEDGDPHIVWGEIRKAWEANGGANGKLGYPTSDEKDITGGKESTFTGGTITWKDGQTTVTPK